MRNVPMTLRFSIDLHRRLENHREETGVPTAVFLRRAAEAALAASPAGKRRTKSRPAGEPSSN